MAPLTKYQKSRIARIVNADRSGDRFRINGKLWACTEIDRPNYRHREAALLTLTRQTQDASYSMQIYHCPWTKKTYIFKPEEALAA